MAEETFRRKLTAILSADVEGYSRLMGEDEDATIRTLTAYRELMSALIQKHRGRVVDSPGDNLLAEFLSVVDAVRCAVEIQEELRVRNAELPDSRRMQFRIGINLGDVVEEEERIYGDGINIAARVEGLAEGGGICISGTVYDSIKNKLSLSYESLGEHTVKNIKEPVRVYRMRIGPEAAAPVIREEKAGPRRWQRAGLVAVAVLVVLAGAWAIWNFYFRPPPIEPASVEKMAYPLPDEPSIAVLPFVNMSEEKGQDFFCDGITEEIITALSKTPKMLVIARNSTFTYKGKPVKVKQVAEELGVRYVMEGSVRKAGDRLRINAQLIDAITGRHLWAERYDRELKDIFTLQDEITMEIIAALQIELTEGAVADLKYVGSKHLEAYENFLKARHHLNNRTKEDVRLGQQFVKEAIDIDSEYAAAYRMMGWLYLDEVWFGMTKSPAKSIEKAEKMARKAVSLKGYQAPDYTLLSSINLLKKSFDDAVKYGEKAVELGPNLSDAHFILGMALRYAGQYDEAISKFEKAIRLDPIPPINRLNNLGWAYLLAKEYESAILIFNKAIQRNPDYLFAYMGLSGAYNLSGDKEKSHWATENVLRINPKFSLARYEKRSPIKIEEDKKRIISAMRNAGLPETPPLPLPDKPSIAVLPFVNMSADPEQEYLSDGIAEEIITALSKTSKLFVIARTSSFKYKSRDVDVRTISRELGIRYVLEGSVRRSGERLRITAQLIDAKTGKHVWAQRYDRDLKDIFAIQDEITMKIITALQVKLTEGEQARLWGKLTKNLDVHLKLLEARSLWAEGTMESHVRFGQVAQEVIDMAPESCIGYRLLAWHYWFLARTGKSPRESIGKAFKLAKKALSINESDSTLHATFGSIYLLMRQYDKAIAAGKRSVELEPNGAMAHGLLGMTLIYADRQDEAIVYLNRAIRLNPFPPYWYFMRLGQSYMQKGEYEEALKAFKKALQRSADAVGTHIYLAALYVLLDRQEEAKAEAKKVMEAMPDFSLEGFSRTSPYKNQAYNRFLSDALCKAGLK
jgi:TolB-like protein/class 3 adenylate cyclase/Tfp pilus assembly protein PilF